MTELQQDLLQNEEEMRAFLAADEGEGEYFTEPMVVAGQQYNSPSFNNMLALKADGVVWAWGSNLGGVLGDPSLKGGASRQTPMPVVGPDGNDYLSDVIYITITRDGRTAAAIKQDGSLWMWGANTNGVLGQGDTVDSKIPKQVRGIDGIGFLMGVKKIAISSSDAMALLEDNTIATWGTSAYGTGLTSTVQKRLPHYVMGPNGVGLFNNVKDIALDLFCTALKNDGAVWCWGKAYAFGTTGIESSYPKQVMTSSSARLTGVTEIGPGIALKQDKSVWTWGSVAYGQLGIGLGSAINYENYAVRVKGIAGSGYLQNIAMIAKGNCQSAHYVVDTGGAAYSWGNVIGDNTGYPTPMAQVVNSLGLYGTQSIYCYYNKDGLVYTNASRLKNGGSDFVLSSIGGEPFNLFEPTPPPPEPPVEPGTPTRVWVQAMVNAKVNLRATALPTELELAGALWSSSDSEIAMVDANGVVTGVAPGTVIITVKAPNDVFEASIGVLVVDFYMDDLRLEVKLRPGESVQLLTTDIAGNLVDDAIWSSDTPLVAQVDEFGVVRYYAPGLACITASTTEGDPVGVVYVRCL